MQIVVTGSNGLLGKSLQKIVQQQNDNNQYHFLTRKECNLINTEEVNTLFDRIRPDIVIHLASMVGGVYENINNNYNMFINNIRINREL